MQYENLPQPNYNTRTRDNNNKTIIKFSEIKKCTFSGKVGPNNINRCSMLVNSRLFQTLRQARTLAFNESNLE